MQHILEGKKRCFRKWQITHLNVPSWPEFGIEKTYADACQVKDFARCMPDEWDTARKIERAFYWDILSTLAQDYVTALILDCRQQRYDNRQEHIKPPTLLNISQDIVEELLGQPFISGKSSSILICC